MRILTTTPKDGVLISMGNSASNRYRELTIRYASFRNSLTLLPVSSPDGVGRGGADADADAMSCCFSRSRSCTVLVKSVISVCFSRLSIDWDRRLELQECDMDWLGWVLVGS